MLRNKSLHQNVYNYIDDQIKHHFYCLRTNLKKVQKYFKRLIFFLWERTWRLEAEIIDLSIFSELRLNFLLKYVWWRRDQNMRFLWDGQRSDFNKKIIDTSWMLTFTFASSMTSSFSQQRSIFFFAKPRL